jgi:protocatechuate 3,4-dioxygenase beta subunit
MRGRLLVLTLSLATAFPTFAAITGTLMNADGQPVAGARVSMHALQPADARRARLLSDTPERVPLSVVQTDAQGKFSFDSPVNPVVEITAAAQGYAPESIRAERDDELGAIALIAAESKTGRITAGGKPVAGARVIWSGGGEFFAITDDQGRYSVPDPAKWAFRVVVVHRDYAVLEDFTRRPMGGATASPDRTLQTGITVTGRVLNEDGKSGVADAQLTVNGWPVATSDADGNFTAQHVPAKWETIEAKAGSLAGARARGSDTTIRLAKTATLSGGLRDLKSRAAIAGAEVNLRRDVRQAGASTASALADAKGNFSVTGLVPGSYIVNVNRPGYSFSLLTMTAAVGDKTSRTILGTQRARVSGMVVDERKRPVVGARVASQLVSRENMFMPNIMSSQHWMSAPDGTFVIRVEPDTDLQIDARKKGFPAARSATVRLTPGERKGGVVITIPGGIIVTGRVADRDGKPIAGVALVAGDTRSEGPGGVVRRVMMAGAMMQRDDDLVRTGSDGTFSVQLKEGTYELIFRREGFAAKTLRSQQINSATRPLEVTLEPGVEIAGRVTRNGVGVDGVMVNLMSEGTLGGNAETNADGSFRIGDLSPGQFMLTANKREEFIQEFRPVTAPASDVAIEIPPGGRITGRVVDKTTKQPVTAFEAGISGARGGGGMMFMGPPQTRPFTSDDGTFTLENVPAGQTNLVVTSSGYTPARVPSLNVEEGKTLADIEVQMDRGVRVTGKVTGPDGAPLPGASVRLDFRAPGGGRVMQAPMQNPPTVTDANGEYTMEAVEAGEKTFQFSRSGYMTTSKTVTLSGNDAKVDVQLSTGVRISGIVVTDGGAPVADASVNAQTAADAGTFRSTRTDANGAFRLEGLAPGRYTFTASKTGYANGINRDVDVSTAGSVRLILQTGGTIYGRVIGLSPEEMTQAVVMASSPNGNASSPADAAGNYRIEGAPSGTVRVRAMLTGMMSSGKSSQVASVQIEPGTTIQQDIEFNASTVIRGRVARDGRPVANAMVMFSPRAGQAQTSARTQTDSGGNFELSGLDDATYNVTVADLSRGSTPYTTTYDVRGSGTFNIDIKSSVLRGRVVDASTGEPISEAAVDLRERDTTGSGIRFAIRTIQTDNSGNFTVDPVPPGAYVVSAEKEGYGTKLVEVTVGDSAADVELKLARQHGIVLRVVDARDGRLLSAMVRVVDLQNRAVYDSPFRMGGGSSEPLKLPLDTGTYRATISAQGYATQNVTLLSPSSPTIGLSPGGAILVRSKGSTLRRARLMGADGREYARGGFMSIFTIDPSPGVTQLDNVAPGRYTLQILGTGEDVIATAVVNVVEGRRAEVEI